MTQEQLVNLRLENLQAPNQVLCYGAGIMGRVLVESYLRAGIHVVGFIDKKKQGTLKTESVTLPIYSIETAVHSVGRDMAVVITVANSEYFSEIKKDLMEAGVSEERIYEWDFLNWVTVPSPKCYCRHLFGVMALASGAILQCCYWGEGRSFNVEMLNPDVSPEQTVERYTRKLRHYWEKAREGEVPLYCAGCSHLSNLAVEGDLQLNELRLAASAQCNIECVYCNAMLETEVKKLPYDAKGYEELFLSMLRRLDKDGLLADESRIVLAGGEISTAPKWRELLTFARNHPNYEYGFLSNCVIYREEIAQVLAQNPKNEIMCDLDSGTPETYLLVKGFSHFDKVTENLKKYAESGRVLLKYIVLPGFNATTEDYLGTVKLLKDLGLTELILSQDHLHAMDLYAERKSLFEVARFKKLLADNGIEGTLFLDSFNERQTRLVNRFYREMP